MTSHPITRGSSSSEKEITTDDLIVSLLPRIRAIATRFSQSGVDADDLVGIAMLKLVQKAQYVLAMPLGQAEAYLCMAARNAMIDAVRMALRRPSISLDAQRGTLDEERGTLAESLCDRDDPFLPLLDAEIVESILVGLSRPSYREIVERRCGLGGYGPQSQSYAEIAEAMRLAPSTARKNGCRAFAELRALLQHQELEISA